MAAFQPLWSSSPSILPKGYPHGQFQPLLSFGLIRRNPLSFTVSTGCRALIRPLKKLYCVPRVLVDAAAVAPNDLIAEDSKSSENLDHGVFKGDGETVSEGEYRSLSEGEDKIISEENEEILADEDKLEETDEELHMNFTSEKLIDVFLVDKPNPSDWRKMLALSKSWGDIRVYFFGRLKRRADAENDPGMKQKLLRLERKLKDIDEDVQRHNELVCTVCAAPSEVDAIVRRRRKDFTKEFFQHACIVASSYYENPERRDELLQLVKKCLVLVKAYDATIETMDAINPIEQQLGDILSACNLDSAGGKVDLFGSSGGKIDFLAGKNQLDSNAMQIAMKAWSDGRPTDMIKTEATDFQLEMYIDALKQAERQLPGELRILKYILTINDPEMRMDILRGTFTPPEPDEILDVDMVYVEPESLLNWIRLLVNIFNTAREDGSQMMETKDFMHPRAIQKLLELEKFVVDHFL